MDCLLSCYSKFTQSSQRFGVHGFNINVSNTTAAVFAATGQDIACLTDSASAFFHLLPVNHISQRSEALEGTSINVMIISIYKLGDVGITSNLIGSLSLTNGHCPPAGRWITKQWPA